MKLASLQPWLRQWRWQCLLWLRLGLCRRLRVAQGLKQCIFHLLLVNAADFPSEGAGPKANRGAGESALVLKPA